MKTSKHYRQILCLIMLFTTLTISEVVAAPQITSISGTIANGQTLTINGSGFGTNGPTIKLYDEFEKGTNGDVISLTAGSATINQWSFSNGSGLTTYTNEWTHSGTQCMKNNWNTPTAEPANQIQLDFSDTAEIFYSFWTMVPLGKNVPGDTRPVIDGGGGGTNSPNWKMSWIWGGVFGNAHANEYVGTVILRNNLSSAYTNFFSV